MGTFPWGLYRASDPYNPAVLEDNVFPEGFDTLGVLATVRKESLLK